MNYDKLYWDTECRLDKATDEDIEYFGAILQVLEDFETLKDRFDRVDKYLEKTRNRL